MSTKIRKPKPTKGIGIAKVDREAYLQAWSRMPTPSDKAHAKGTARLRTRAAKNAQAIKEF